MEMTALVELAQRNVVTAYVYHSTHLVAVPLTLIVVLNKTAALMVNVWTLLMVYAVNNQPSVTLILGRINATAVSTQTVTVAAVLQTSAYLSVSAITVVKAVPVALVRVVIQV